jgi:hypothetical protein
VTFLKTGHADREQNTDVVNQNISRFQTASAHLLRTVPYPMFYDVFGRLCIPNATTLYSMYKQQLVLNISEAKGLEMGWSERP